MDFNNNEFILLSKEQVFGKIPFERKKIDIIKTIGERCAVTDYAILL